VAIGLVAVLLAMLTLRLPKEARDVRQDDALGCVNG
jgi:hypothetical protein